MTLNLVGERFGRLTVMRRVQSRTSPSGKKFTVHECRCDCGGVKNVMTKNLTEGLIKSCGCLRKQSMKTVGSKNLEDVIGKRFGSLTVVKRVEDYVSPGGRHLTQYECRCDCGNTKDVTKVNLIGSKTTHCGCLKQVK